MRARLVLFLFLLVSTMVSQRLSPEQIHKQMGKFNYGRGVMAVKKQIGNMWKLEWDEDLVNIALNMTKSCPDLKPGPNYRYFFANPDEKAMVYETTLEEELMKVSDYEVEEWINEFFDANTMYALEFWVPLQKRVGCIEYKCHRDLKVKKIAMSVNWSRLCVIGPVRTVSTSYAATGKKAGSECGRGAKTEGPLCVPNASGIRSARKLSDHLADYLQQEHTEDDSVFELHELREFEENTESADY